MHRRLFASVFCVALAAIAWPTVPSGQAPPARATWLWDPDPMLANADTRAAMFGFLERERISVVWAQVGTDGMDLKSAPAWRSFIAEAAKRGMRIEALDGAATYAVQEDIPKRVLEAVLAYNESAKTDERFSGIHFDIEPYLLWSWRSQRGRTQVLRRYLSLLQWCKARMANEFPGMKLGVDIPFWWQKKDDRTGRAIGDVEFGGETKAASFHVIDLLDNVGIMNYRNRAVGSNGMIALGEDLLAYADRAKKASLWMGVETSREQSTPVWFVVGLPRDTATALLEGDTGINEGRQYKGFKLSVFDDGNNINLGLGLAGKDSAAPPRALTAALAALAKSYGVLSRPGTEDRGSAARVRVLKSLGADPEWRNPVDRAVVDPETGTEYPGVMATSAMLSTLTFDGLPADAFRRETSLAEQAYLRHPSYRGLAIHHYESFRKLMTGSGPVAPLMSKPGSSRPHY